MCRIKAELECVDFNSQDDWNTRNEYFVEILPNFKNAFDPNSLISVIKYNQKKSNRNYLGFLHPTSGKEIYFEAKRPKDLDELIKILKKASI